MNVWIPASNGLQSFHSRGYTGETSFLLFSQKWFWTCLLTPPLSCIPSNAAMFLQLLGPGPQLAFSPSLAVVTSACHHTWFFYQLFIFFFKPVQIPAQSFLLNRRKQLSAKASAVPPCLTSSSFPPKPASWEPSALFVPSPSSSAPCSSMSPPHTLLHVTSPRATWLWPACSAPLGRVGTALGSLPGGVGFALWGQRHLKKRGHPSCSQGGCLCLHCSPWSPSLHAPLPAGTRWTLGFLKTSEKSRTCLGQGKRGEQKMSTDSNRLDIAFWTSPPPSPRQGCSPAFS